MNLVHQILLFILVTLVYILNALCSLSVGFSDDILFPSLRPVTILVNALAFLRIRIDVTIITLNLEVILFRQGVVEINF